MSLVHITPYLSLSAEESRLGALKILEQIIIQVIEKVGGKTILLEHELVHTPETDSKMEFKQLPQLWISPPS